MFTAPNLKLQTATKLVETLSDVLLTLKGENKAFPSPSPACIVVPLFKLPTENNKHPNCEWRRGGGVSIVLFFEDTLFEYNVSTILSPIVGPIRVKPRAGNGKGRSRLQSTHW